MFFRKEVKCEKCGVSVPKKLVGDFDTTYQGRRKEGFKLRLCNSCMISLLTEHLLSFNERSVIVHPSVRYNTYAFYQFDELITSSRHSLHKSSDIEFINDVKELLPPKQAKCGSCGEFALFTWIPLGVFDNNPFNWYVNKDLMPDYAYLCKKCLIKAFSEIVYEEDITFSAIFPPIKGDGFCTPWQV